MSKKWRVGLYFLATTDFDVRGERKWVRSNKLPGKRFYNAKQALTFATEKAWHGGYAAFVHRVGEIPDCMTEHLIGPELVSKRKGYGKMAQKTFHIELRCIGVDDDKKFNSIKKAAQASARMLHAQAMLVCAADSPPQILLYGEDFINGKQEIDKGTDDDLAEEADASRQ